MVVPLSITTAGNHYSNNDKDSVYYICREALVMKSRLKELRARQGINQTELSRLAKISRQTVSLIEREEYMPSLLIAVRIARVFGEKVEDVFVFEEEEL